MAANRSFAAEYARQWPLDRIERAIGILLEYHAEPDAVVNEYLAEEGYTMRVSTASERGALLETLQAARDIKEGTSTPDQPSHRLNFSRRRTET